MNPELSLCIIARDEEPYLARCVESFGAIFDELVIVDTGSKDRTEEVARELLRDREGRLERFEWCDDFAAARNHACSFARAPWILMVDADEFLAPGQRPRVILDAIREAPEKIKNLLLVDLSLIDGQVVMAHPVNRLFRNRPDVRWKGRIHETLTVAGDEQIQTQITLCHDNAKKRDRDARLPEGRSRMYEAGLRQDAARDPENPRHHFYLGNTLAERHEWRAALAAYERYLELARTHRAANDEVVQAWLNVALCRRSLQDEEGSRRALVEALALAPGRTEALLGLGDLALAKDRLEEARTWYEFAACVPRPKSALFVDALAYGARPWWQLSTALARSGDHRSALVAVERALAYSPSDPDIIERRAQLELALLDDEPPTIVIPSRTPELAARCLEGVLASEDALYHEALIVCDGGTAPFEPLRDRFPRLRLVAGARPFVFARNANIGIDACRGDVVLLNDDAVPASRGWIDELRRIARGRKDAGPVSALLSRSGNPAQDVGWRDDRVDAIETDRVTFACVYLTRELIDQVGPLDPGFVWYGWEDDDYCARAREQGRKPLVAQRAFVRHDEPSSSFRSPQQMRLLEQARRYFVLKRREPQPALDVLVVTRGHASAPACLARLCETTREDCRIIVIHGGDESVAAALRELDDPRLVLHLASEPIADSRVLEELASATRADAIVQVEPDVLLPPGWSRHLLADQPHRIERLGILALARGAAPREAALRVGGVPVVPATAEAIGAAAARLVARRTLEEFSPLGAGETWARLADRLERRRRLNGFVPGVAVE